VDYATFDGSATNGVDYIGVTNMLAIAPGEKSKLLSIQVLNNSLKQATRYFTLSLSNPTGGALLILAKASVSILANDPGVGFSQTRYTNALGSDAKSITVTVSRGNDWSLGRITVDYATSDLTALAGQDYQSQSGTLDFRRTKR